MTGASTGAVVAAVSASSAASAQQAASDAQDAACRVVLRTFDSRTATAEQSYEYADCVNRFRPDGGSEVLVAKAVICVILLGAVIGGVRGWLHSHQWYGEGDVFEVFVGAVGGVVLATVALVAAAAVTFVLTA